MSIKEKTVEAMNTQIGNEFLASAQYIAIGVFFDELRARHLAHFFYRQSDADRDHAMRFVRFLLGAGAHPIIPAVPNLRHEFSSAADAVGFALEGERRVTHQIQNLVAIAEAQGDASSVEFLHWFVAEQTREIGRIAALLQTVHESGGGLAAADEHARRLLADETA